ncbi:MAG: dihydroorotate dehydrogenase [Armatimonadota bacterium]
MGLTNPNLKINFAGIEIKNPVTVASGTFGFGKEMSDFFDLSILGAIIVKGVSKEPWLGNDYPRTVETPSGMLNAIGLQNEGVNSFIDEKLPFLSQYDVPVIVNVVGHSVEEYEYVTKKLDPLENIAALEINVSCPNVKEGCIVFGSSEEGIKEVVSKVRNATSKPIITKLSPNTGDIVSLAQAAVDAGSDAVSLINTILGTAIDPWKRTFRLANKTGGLSGPAIKPIALRMVYDVARSIDVPVLGMGGIMNSFDAVEFMLAGASAISIGTANFVNPMSASDIIDGLIEYMISMNIENINEIIGTVK